MDEFVLTWQSHYILSLHLELWMKSVWGFYEMWNIVNMCSLMNIFTWYTCCRLNLFSTKIVFILSESSMCIRLGYILCLLKEQVLYHNHGGQDGWLICALKMHYIIMDDNYSSYYNKKIVSLVKKPGLNYKKKRKSII